MSTYGESMVEHPSALDWDPRSGFSAARHWVGLRAEVLDYSLALRALKIRHHIEDLPDGLRAEITAEYGSETDGTSLTQPPDEPLAVKWDMLGSELDKPIWTAPLVRVEIGKIPDADNRRKFRSRMEAYVRGEDTTQAEEFEVDLTMANLNTWAVTWSGSTITAGFVEQLALILMTTTDTIQVKAYVLQRVKTVAGNTSIVMDYSNVLSYWTTTELIADEDVPTFLFGALPDGYWIKKTPTSNQVSSGKWEITQQWVYADFVFELICPHRV